MSDTVSNAEVIRRIENIEKRVDDLEDKVHKGEISDSAVTQELKDLKTMFTDFKLEVISTIQDQTKQMWKLIFILISLFSALLGVTKLTQLW